ncbi:hypothetical protein BN2475_170089 [Paraburkholderia ribeironis]|uniref:Uncharacterized protein n=1 Tax=Paraburkholderia ribeironis TaxID=1247936 RepID=A0A1N7RUQ6_9BURK|nr:hypothetical protein [Paraburkholderia ribeironis]SIT38832.1 hypothetical protein BN2475_170089 [Paraburkholderia ribeironis]
MSSKYIYQLEFDVKTELGAQWSEGLKVVLDSFQKGGRPAPEIYTTYVGNGEKAFIRIPLDSLGEMDNWVHTPDLVFQNLGDQKAGATALAKWAQSFKHWESRILLLSQDGH